jgi:hypothetical protein
MMNIQITVKGTEPLLMHRFNDGSIPTTTGKSKVKKSKEVSIEDIAELAAYKDEDGELYAPTNWFFQSIMGAGRFQKIRINGGTPRQISTRDDSVVPACVWMVGQKAPLNCKEYKIFSTSAVNKNNNARIMTHRPMIENWGCTFTVRLDENFMSEEVLYQLFTDAGMRVGVGSYRPEHKGSFGTFLIEKWETSPII